MKESIIKDYLDKMVEEGVFPGYQIGIIKGEETYSFYGGYSQIYPYEKPMEMGLLFDLASVSKVLATVSACLFLIEEGKLHLDSEVKDFFSEFDEKIKIRHLLTHTSGLEADLTWKDRDEKTMLNSISTAKFREDYFEKKMVYSDIGFLILGLIINKLTGDLQAYLQEKLFRPLGMKNTLYNPPVKEICVPTELTSWRGLVQGEVHDEKSLVLGGITGHAGLFSNLEDILNYCRMLLNGGIFKDKRILSPGSIELLRQPLVCLQGEARSLGWLISTPVNPYCEMLPLGSLFHAGFTGPSLLLNFDERKACILLTNRIHPHRDKDLLSKRRRLLHNRVFSLI